MRRPVDLVEGQIKLIVARPATPANLYQRKRFTDVRNKLNKEMNNILEPNDTVGKISSLVEISYIKK